MITGSLTALKSVFINFPKQGIFGLTEGQFGEDNQSSNKKCSKRINLQLQNDLNDLYVFFGQRVKVLFLGQKNMWRKINRKNSCKKV